MHFMASIRLMVPMKSEFFHGKFYVDYILGVISILDSIIQSSFVIIWDVIINQRVNFRVSFYITLN